MEDLNKLIKSSFKIKEDKDLYKLTMAITNCRCLNYEFYTYPEKVIKDILDCSNYDVLFYPCEVMELRHILDQNEISSNKNFIVSSLSFANKYFLNHPVLLGFSLKDEVVNTYGGISLVSNIKDLKSKLKKIHIKRSSINEDIFCNIKEILKDFDIKTETNLEVTPQGLKTPSLN